MGAVARWSSGLVPVSLVLAAVVLAGAASLPTSPPASGSLAHLSPLGGGPTISVAPAQGPEGANFTVDGTGFNDSGTANVTFAGLTLLPVGGSDCVFTAPNTNITTDPSGDFSCNFTVPTEAAGTYSVTANNTNTSALSNTVSFVVTVPAIAVSPMQGPQGAPVTVSGTGFSPSVALTSLVFDGVAISACTSGSLVPGPTGVVSCSFAVPAGTSGTSVVATDATSATASTTFVVTVPAISVVPGQGPEGAQVTVAGTGFTVTSTLASLAFDTVGVTSCSSGTLSTDASGAFSCTFPVPAGTSGTTVVATDANGQVADGTFSVTTVAIVVTPVQGPVHATVKVAGTGFSVNSVVTLSFDSVAVPGSSCTPAGLSTGSTGEFNCTLVVPAGTTGTTVLVTDAGGQSATGTFTVTTPTISVTPSHGPDGAPVTVSGTGFSVSTALTSLVLDGVAITTCTTGSLASNASGGFTCSFSVPPGTSGTTVIATDVSGQTATGSFTVTTPSITVTPGQGPQGGLVTVHGTGFTVSSTLASLDFDGVAISGCASGSPSTDATGAFSCSFAVPGGTTTSTVTATDANGQSALGAFTVTVPAISVTPGHGPVGSPVDVRGTGFSVSTMLESLTLDGIAITSCTSGTLTANSTGVFSCTFLVPSGTSGTTVRATDIGGQYGTDSFQVTTESILITPSMGPVAAPFVITGTGFTASEGVRVTFGALPISPTTSPGCTDGTPNGAEVTTSAAGSFSCTFVVPSGSPGDNDVVATDVFTDTTSNSELFVVTVPTIVVTPSQGPIGGDFSVTGTGFTVSSTATVSFSGVLQSPEDCSVGSSSGSSITTNATGTFVCTFDVPTEGPSSYPVVATDLTTSTPSNTVTFTVTGVAIGVSPSQGPAGTSVTISGTGFSVSTAIASLVFDGVPVSSCASGSLITGPTGAFACTIAVPAGTSGTSVEVTDAGGQSASTQFTVTVPSLTVAPNQGTIGSTFGLSGTGFQGSTELNITVGSVTWTPTLCTVGSVSGATVTTSAGGAFGCTFLLATQPGGPITLVATQGTNTATVSFQINPSITISTASGGVGTVLGFTGSGFAADAGYSVDWNATTILCSGTTSASGLLACSATVPIAPAGAHTISVVQGASTAGGEFSVVPSIAVSPMSGAVGTTITVSGSGFDAASSFIVTWQGTSTVCSGSTNSNGGFSCSFAVPSATVGAATIMVSEGSYTPTFSFTVSAGPPSNSGAGAFPWWIVAVIALVAVALLVLGLVYQHRRHHRPRAAPPRAHGYGSVGAPRPWDESPAPAGTPSTGAAGPAAEHPMAVPPAAGLGAAESPSPETNPEDIDALISRLERMSIQMFNKTPKQLSESSIAEAPADSDSK